MTRHIPSRAPRSLARHQPSFRHAHAVAAERTSWGPCGASVVPRYCASARPSCMHPALARRKSTAPAPRLQPCMARKSNVEWAEWAALTRESPSDRRWGRRAPSAAWRPPPSEARRRPFLSGSCAGMAARPARRARVAWCLQGPPPTLSSCSGGVPCGS